MISMGMSLKFFFSLSDVKDTQSLINRVGSLFKTSVHGPIRPIAHSQLKHHICILLSASGGRALSHEAACLRETLFSSTVEGYLCECLREGWNFNSGNYLFTTVTN